MAIAKVLFEQLYPKVSALKKERHKVLRNAERKSPWVSADAGRRVLYNPEASKEAERWYERELWFLLRHSGWTRSEYDAAENEYLEAYYAQLALGCEGGPDDNTNCTDEVTP
jgi:hypothetical protein